MLRLLERLLANAAFPSGELATKRCIRLDVDVLHASEMLHICSSTQKLLSWVVQQQFNLFCYFNMRRKLNLYN